MPPVLVKFWVRGALCGRFDGFEVRVEVFVNDVEIVAVGLRVFRLGELDVAAVRDGRGGELGHGKILASDPNRSVPVVAGLLVEPRLSLPVHRARRGSSSGFVFVPVEPHVV